jgi:hypothetical protein
MRERMRKCKTLGGGVRNGGEGVPVGCKELHFSCARGTELSSDISGSLVNQPSLNLSVCLCVRSQYPFIYSSVPSCGGGVTAYFLYPECRPPFQNFQITKNNNKKTQKIIIHWHSSPLWLPARLSLYLSISLSFPYLYCMIVFYSSYLSLLCVLAMCICV